VPESRVPESRANGQWLLVCQVLSGKGRVSSRGLHESPGQRRQEEWGARQRDRRGLGPKSVFFISSLTPKWPLKCCSPTVPCLPAKGACDQGESHIPRTSQFTKQAHIAGPEGHSQQPWEQGRAGMATPIMTVPIIK
jgi:hypothetical protein